MVDLVRTFFRAGIQRLNAAEILYNQGVLLDALDLGGFYLGGFYLGGHCVECSMKAMILKHVPRSQHERFVRENFDGQKAHDLEFLRHLWKKHRCESVNPAMLKSWRKFASVWNTSLRYEVGKGDRKPADVHAAMEFAREFSAWVKERLT